MKLNGYLLAVSFICLFIFSCSGAQTGPIGPSPDAGMNPIVAPQPQKQVSNTYLLGNWEVRIDLETETAEAVPLRGLTYTANVTSFINGPPWNLLLGPLDIDAQSMYTDIGLDVGLRHPFPGQDTYTGFDLLGVLMGYGSGHLDATQRLSIPTGADQQLLNADGYTRWFNHDEFYHAGLISPIFGYHPGAAGTQGYTPSCQLNAYRYYASGLDRRGDAFDYLASHSAQRGSFKPGESNYRRYEIRFPARLGVLFQYAVIAHWDEHRLYPDPPNSLNDFPPEANADEALVINVDDYSDLYYSDGEFGGQVSLDITPWDWSAVSNGTIDEYIINCYSKGWNGAYNVDMHPTGGSEHQYTFHADIPVNNLESSNPLPVWIEVLYPDLDYSNDFGIDNDASGSLASYFKYDVPVDNEPPAWIQVTRPNGGEVFYPGTTEEITWDSGGVTGNVFIEYSKNYFNSDINTIAVDEPNDGSYMWENIPYDPSIHVKVRVSSTDDPSVNDRSDQVFKLFGPWIEVTSPNGGEQWEPTTSETITWDTNDVTGTVFIEYSKDDFASDIHTIVTDTANDGSYLWQNIPVDPSDTVKVRISSTDDPTTNDTSNGYFTIIDVPVAVTVTSPNGFEKWRVGTEHDITWTTDYVPGTVFIEYSKDNFVSDINTIAVDEVNDGTYLWSGIPNDPSTTVKVRVGVTADPSVYDASDDNFSIVLTSGWAQTWGGIADDEGSDVVVDNSGNYYVTGTFRDTVDFNPASGVENRTSNGAKDIFLSKFNSFGVFQWVVTWGGIGDEFAQGATLDNSGNIYVTGSFQSTVDFDPGGGSANRTASGLSDCFLSKFDPSGNLIWVAAFGGPENDQVFDVSVDGSGNPCVAGTYAGTVDFDPGSGSDTHTAHTSPQGFPTQDIFASRFNSSGNHSWVRVWGGGAVDYGQGVSMDAAGNVTVTGWYQDTVDFNPEAGTDNRTSNGSGDIFVSRFNSVGTYQWARTWGGTDNDVGSSVFDDGAGSIYVVGRFESAPADFDPGAGTDNHSSNGLADAFLGKFNAAGTFQWARTWGGSGSDAALALDLNGLGDILVTGQFSDTVDFDPGGGTQNETSSGSTDGYLSKFNSSGTFQWVRIWGSSFGDTSRGLSLGSTGAPHLTGGFNSTAEFAPIAAPCNDLSDQHTSNGGSDVYLLKFMPTGCW